MKEKIKVILKGFNQIYYILEPRHRKKLPRLFISIFLVAILELLGVTAILPFVYALVDTEAVFDNKYFAPVLSYFNIADTMRLFVFLGVGIVVLYLIKNALWMLCIWYENNFSSRVQKELSIRMIHSYYNRPYEFFLDISAGEIMRGCDQDVIAVYRAIQNIFKVAMSAFTTVLVGVYMILADTVIALGTLGVAIVTVILITKIVRPFLNRLSRRSKEALRKKNDALNQTIYGIKELYVMGRQDMFIEEYEMACESRRNIDVKVAVVYELPNRVVESLFITGFVGLIIFRLSLGGSPASYVPKLASFAIGAFKVLPYISTMINKINDTLFQMPYVEGVYENIKAAEKYNEEKRKSVQNNKEAKLDEEDGKAISFENLIEVNNIQWKYSKGVVPVLSNASLQIKKGESIGLIGKSGSGKTTMSDVILGLLKPQQGSVYMDNIDIFTIPKNWSRIVGYVPQSVFLMAGTIRQNVAFGMKGFSDEDIWNALEKAQLKEYVESLPEGLDTFVGERGLKLSGGQRQRIAIARALANKPDVLVLDEATSALDNDTERAIMEAIESLQGHMTLLIVAHRLTTIKNCDRIYSIEDGKAKEVNKENVL